MKNLKKILKTPEGQIFSRSDMSLREHIHTLLAEHKTETPINTICHEQTSLGYPFDSQSALLLPYVCCMIAQYIIIENYESIENDGINIGCARDYASKWYMEDLFLETLNIVDAHKTKRTDALPEM